MSAVENTEALEFEDLLSEISATFVRATEDRISPQIDEWLKRIVLALDIDRARVAQFDPADGLLYTTHQWVREGVIPTPRVCAVSACGVSACWRAAVVHAPAAPGRAASAAPAQR